MHEIIGNDLANVRSATIQVSGRVPGTECRPCHGTRTMDRVCRSGWLMDTAIASGIVPTADSRHLVED